MNISDQFVYYYTSAPVAKQLFTKLQNIAIQIMSDHEINHARQLIEASQPTNTWSQSQLIQRVLGNSMFKLVLKDIIEELLAKKEQQGKQSQHQQPVVDPDILMEQISDSLYLLTSTEAAKKIKEAQKFLQEMYQHKIKELEGKFEEMVEKKMNQIQQKISQIESQTKFESSLLSPVKPILKSKQLAELSVNQHISKRIELKQKILNCSFTPQARHSVNAETVSVLSDSLNDAVLQKLNEKISSIDERLRQQIKSINMKISNMKTQNKKQLQQIEASIREQINSGFEGIWNVISNLEKRMMI